ncbi:Serine/threonine-protein phosphatase 7 long form like [Apostasia shenzhenica]|uniref:Serine/threonine-protein phosphatase 7 long form like n=1 Tax=Apostasia shenzhenica TaxID=1088818 RepID=A0A2H9ZVI8_9ASPA|nr:Serine/threonine-protein phosphatase 7 long form like [Apostasia shenzhenica]
MLEYFLVSYTSGCEIHLQWLTLLEDYKLFRGLSLGAAVLAQLSTIVGCLHLLQIWAWERLHIDRLSRQLPAHQLIQRPLGIGNSH